MSSLKRAWGLATALVVSVVAASSVVRADEKSDEKTPAPKPAETPEATPAATTDEKPDGENTSSEWGFDGPYALVLHGRLGGGGRVDAPPAYELERAGGILLGVGLGVKVSPRIAFGLTYEHLDLGLERSGVLDAGVVNITRGVHVGWLDVDLYPIRFDPIGIYVSLAAGLSVQTADLTASLWAPENPGDNISFFCGGSGDPGFAFQGAVGVDAVVGSGIYMMIEGGVANHRLSDDIVGNCVSGAGTVTALALRTGLGYAFDL